MNKSVILSSLLSAAAVSFAAPGLAQDGSGALSDAELETLSVMQAFEKPCDKLDNFAVRHEELEWFYEDRLRSVNSEQREELDEKRKLAERAIDLHADEADSREEHRAMVFEQCNAMAKNAATGRFFVSRS